MLVGVENRRVGELVENRRVHVGRVFLLADASGRASRDDGTKLGAQERVD